MFQYEPRNPTFRAAEWDIGTLTLTKPCGCEIRLLARQAFERHDVGYCPFSGAAIADLQNEIDKVRDENGFNHRFYRKRHAKQARHSWLCVLELTDRLEREEGIGAYNPAALELMRNLAREKRAEHLYTEVSQDGVCDACGMEGYFPQCLCPGCLDGLKQIDKADQELPAVAKQAVRTLADKRKKYYQITLGQSRDEMLIEIGEERAKARNPLKRATQ